MATTIINFVQELVHFGSVLAFTLISVLLIAGLVRPSIFKNLMHNFTDRKYIAGLGIFICMFCATVFVATDTTSQDYQQQQDKQAVAQAGVFIEQPEQASPAPREEAQPAAVQSTQAVQGAQTTSQDMPPAPAKDTRPAPANNNSDNSSNQSAQAAEAQSECKGKVRVSLLGERICIL